MGLTRAQAYAVAAVVSGVLWSLLVYVGKSPSVTATDLVVFLVGGSGTGLAVSYMFRSAFRRARMPWTLFLPLATVPLGVSVFAGLVWAGRLALGYHTATRYLELLSDLTLELFFFYPLVYVLAFINQWILHLVLVEHGAYRPGARFVRLFLIGGLLSWIALLIWFFASQARLPNSSSTASIAGARPGVLCTLSSDGEGGLLHVLVLQPSDSRFGTNGGNFTMTYTQASERIMWDLGATRRSLTFTFHGLTEAFEIEGESWSTAKGNMFVVSLDEDWRPSVQPLALKSNGTDRRQVLAEFQKALPGDLEIASLHFLE
jgi:hypothetical protein